MTKESSGLLLLPLGRGLGGLSLPALRIPLLLRALGAIMGIALGTKGRKIDADLPQGRAVPVI